MKNYLNAVQGLPTPKTMTLNANFYKLNIYEEGGFFTEHVDSLHGSNHFASFVMLLPSKHEGGTLLVSHEKEIKRFEFDKLSSNIQCIQWTCFYTDCVHKVEHVTSGTRVLPQFDVYIEAVEEKDEEIFGYLDNLRRDESETKSSCDDNVYNQAHLEKLSAALEEILGKGISSLDVVPFWDTYSDNRKSKRIQPGGIAFLLSHRYHSDALVWNILKGSDEILFRHLSSCPKFQVFLTPVIFKTMEYGCCHDKSIWTFPFPKSVQRLITGSVQEEQEKVDLPTHLQDVYFIPSMDREDLYFIQHKDGAEHKGNESMDHENYYYAGALLVTLKNTIKPITESDSE